MPRQPRQFEYNKPIDVTTRYTRSVSISANEFWRIKILLRQLNKRYNIKLLKYYYNEKQFQMRLYFEKGCGCTLSRVMQWFLTRLAKIINSVMKSHGKVFYDRFVSNILKLISEIQGSDDSFNLLNSALVSDPETSAKQIKAIHPPSA